VADYDLDKYYSPDTGLEQSSVLDLASPKYSPNKTYIFDKSRYNNHGTIFGGAPWVSLPRGFRCLSFDGSDDYVDCGNPASLQIVTDQTIICWFYAIVMPVGAYHVVAKYWVLSLFADGRLRWETRKADASGWDTTTYSTAIGAAGVWMQAAAVYNTVAQTTTCFINAIPGTPVAKVDGGMGNSATNSVKVGGYTNRWYGYLALPRYFASAFSTAQLVQLYGQERHLFGV